MNEVEKKKKKKRGRAVAAADAAKSAKKTGKKRKSGAGSRSPAAASRAAATESSNTPPAELRAESAPVLLLRLQMPVRWRDLDAFNHVNNSVFLTYLEEARLKWLESLAAPWTTEEVAPLIAAIHVNYRRPITWPMTLAIELYADRLGNSSITLGHKIVRADEPEVVYSDGYAVMVWADAATGKAASLPDAVRTAANRAWVGAE